MRVLLHCIYFPPEVGGLETHVYTLCRELARRGHQVRVVTSRSSPGSPAREVMDGVEVHRVWCPGKHPAGWIATTLLSIPRFLALSREADVLHCHTFPSALPGRLARRLRQIPLVVTIHTSHFLRLSRKWWFRPIMKKLLMGNDQIYATSGELRDVVLSYGPESPVEAITNGVDADLFRPVPPRVARAPGEIVLVCPRRLFEKTGVEYLLRALPLIREKAPARCEIVGDGPLRGHLERLAGELGVASHVTFWGAVANREMPGFLCSADVVVIPSLIEATSLAALEAMACERPVAASRVGGLPEIIDEEVGALFRPADPGDCARAVLSLLERADRAALGGRGRRRVMERWSVGSLTEKHVALYRRLIGEGWGRRG